MPFKNEHSARLREPSDFVQDSFVRLEDKLGKGIDSIMGKLVGQTELTLQGIRFDKNIFTPEQAEKWLKDHNYEPIEFEPAQEKKTMSKTKETKICTEAKVAALDTVDGKIAGDSFTHGFISGYAAVYGVRDSDGDVILPGSFDRAIKNQIAAGSVPLMVRHFRDGGDVMESIGQIIEGREDEFGFKIIAALDGTEESQKVRQKAISNPNILGMSVGWLNTVDGFRKFPEGGREFREMNLKEVTITLMPAQPNTLGTVQGKTEGTEEIAAPDSELLTLVKSLVADVAELKGKVVSEEVAVEDTAAEVDAGEVTVEDTGDDTEADTVDTPNDSDAMRRRRSLTLALLDSLSD